MPLYALTLKRDGDAETTVLDSGARRYYLHDTIEYDGQEWEIVTLDSQKLDTPDGVQVVEELVCVRA